MLLFFCSYFCNPVSVAMAEQDVGKFYQMQALTLQGQTFAFDSLMGKVVVIVNTASKCGFTSQYGALQELYERFHSKGLVILGFPSNDFGGQEPGTNKDIDSFCKLNYGVTFPMMEKGPVTGSAMQPVYRYLLAQLPGASIKWNFEKIVVDRSGRVITKFASSIDPLDSRLVELIEK
jgi:glutathione peroxidase